MNRDDCTIICGDFGGLWADTPAEAYWLDCLEEKPFTTLFVDGNHENFDRLTDFLEMVKQRCQFDYWFMGHYNRNCVVDERFVIHWEQMVELEYE